MNWRGKASASVSDDDSALVRSPEAFGYTDSDIDQASYERSLAEAKEAASSSLGPRCAVMVVAKDRSGLVRDVSQGLISEAINIEGASQATLGGCCALSLVVSSEELIDSGALKSRLATVPGLDCEQVVFAPLRGRHKRFPDRSFSRWNVYGTAQDRAGVLHEVTAVLAHYGGEPVRLLSLVLNNDVCETDLTVALPPGAPIQSIVTELRETYAARVNGHLRSFSQFRPQSDRSLSWLLANQATFGDARFLSIVGQAQRGLVSSITGALAASDLNILGSSMDVIRGHVVGMFAVSGAGDSEILEAIASPVGDFQLHPAVCGPPTEAYRQLPATLCFISLLAADTTGVLAAASRALSAHGANIERLRADLIDDPQGTFAIDAFVSLPAGIELDVLAKALASEGVEWLVAPEPIKLPNDSALDLVPYGG